jgi:peptidoglycan glycosyltransferase
MTIDAELQKAVVRALKKYTEGIRDRRTGRPKTKAAAVVLDVYTGEVLAAASIPDFDPNELTPGVWKSYNEGEGSGFVLINRALNGLYPPGSTFKLVTAASALENGVGLTYTCRHREQNIRWRADGQTWSRRWITDLEEMGAHGSTDLPKAVRVSCNIYFAHLGLELGQDRLYETAAQKFKLANIPPPKRLAQDLPDNAYGQGRILVTPVEMARVVATIANGGVMMKPQFVRDIRIGEEVVQEFEPVEMGRPISPATSAALRRMMADVVTRGTGKGLFAGLNVSVAGKTGSAENDHADRMPHSWFVGFAPVEDPRIAFAVVVENGGYGRAAAGPVCREIVQAAL